jgi:hypothetical protein
MWLMVGLWAQVVEEPSAPPVAEEIQAVPAAQMTLLERAPGVEAPAALSDVADQTCTAQVHVSAEGLVDQVTAAQCESDALAAWYLESLVGWRFEPVLDDAGVAQAVVVDDLPLEWRAPVRDVSFTQVRIKKSVPPRGAKDLPDAVCTARFFIDEQGKPYEIRLEDCPETHHEVVLDAA